MSQVSYLYERCASGEIVYNFKFITLLYALYQLIKCRYNAVTKLTIAVVMTGTGAWIWIKPANMQPMLRYEEYEKQLDSALNTIVSTTWISIIVKEQETLFNNISHFTEFCFWNCIFSRYFIYPFQSFPWPICKYLNISIKKRYIRLHATVVKSKTAHRVALLNSDDYLVR